MCTSLYVFIYVRVRECVCCHLDPLSFGGVGQLVHAALDVIQPGQQVMGLPSVLVPLGSDGQCLPVPQHTQVLHINTHTQGRFGHRSNFTCLLHSDNNMRVLP